MAADGSSSHAIAGECATATRLKATACSVCPDGKLNSSSGAIHARMRTSAANGRGRRAQRLIALYSSSATRSEEHTSELQSLMRISYSVFCLKKKTSRNYRHYSTTLQATCACIT